MDHDREVFIGDVWAYGDLVLDVRKFGGDTTCMASGLDYVMLVSATAQIKMVISTRRLLRAGSLMRRTPGGHGAHLTGDGQLAPAVYGRISSRAPNLPVDIALVAVRLSNLLDALHAWARSECGAREAETLLGRLAEYDDVTLGKEKDNAKGQSERRQTDSLRRDQQVAFEAQNAAIDVGEQRDALREQLLLLEWSRPTGPDFDDGCCPACGGRDWGTGEKVHGRRTFDALAAGAPLPCALDQALTRANLPTQLHRNAERAAIRARAAARAAAAPPAT